MNLLVKLGTVNLDTLATIGIVAGIFLSIALVLVTAILLIGKFFKVNVDEKVTKVLENLAGANCGGCGCSGCSGFAEKLACGKADLSDCHVTSAEKKAEIAKLLGVDLSEEEPTVAVVKCSGGERAKDEFVYGGNRTCAACNALLGGNKACKTACLGCGDCARACPENAISVVGGVAKVDPARCTSCGACINACPKHIIERIPVSAPVYVACSSHCKLKEVTAMCDAGCRGCGVCAKACPNGAIMMEDNLPVFDYKKCTGCMACVEKCPKKVILKRA